MSYALVAAVVATTMMSVATWQAFAPMSEPMSEPVSEPSATLSGSRIAGQASPGLAKASVLHVSSGLLPDGSRPPVPLLRAHRPPVVSLVAAASGDAVVPDNNATPAADLTDEKAARAAIERDGYKGVHALSQRADGVWQARALRGTTEVAVTVDRASNVSAN